MLLRGFCLLPLYPEQIPNTVEVLLQDNANALGRETVASEITVVGLIVDPHSEVAVGLEEIAQIEIANETGCGIGVVAIAKLPVEEQPVVEKTSTDKTLILGIVPTLVARGDIGTKIPVGIVDDSTQDIVDLLRNLPAKNALHCEGGLALLHGTLCCGVVDALRIESAQGKQIKHLLVFLFFAIDDAHNHLLGVVAHRGHVHVERHLR